MKMIRRISAFLLLNFLIVIAISLVLSIFRVTPYLKSEGIDLSALMALCLIWGMVGAFISLLLSRKMAKWMLKIHIVSPNSQNSQEKQLLEMLERLSYNAGLSTTPELGIFSAQEVNAFATGPSRKRSLVALSSGLLNRMRPEEVEGVMAHEIAHIANGDMVTMTLLQGVVNAFVMFLARLLAYGISVGSRNKRVGSMTFYLLTTIFEIVFMIFGSLLTAFYSRRREFRADADGASFSSKEKMVSALKVLESLQQQKSAAPSQLRAMMISSQEKFNFTTLFATHPPLKKRIDRLLNRQTL